MLTHGHVGRVGEVGTTNSSDRSKSLTRADLRFTTLPDGKELACLMVHQAKNAQQLKALTHALADEPVPRAPKQPKQGLGAFFSRSAAPATGQKRERPV